MLFRAKMMHWAFKPHWRKKMNFERINRVLKTFWFQISRKPRFGNKRKFLVKLHLRRAKNICIMICLQGKTFRDKKIKVIDSIRWIAPRDHQDFDCENLNLSSELDSQTSQCFHYGNSSMNRMLRSLGSFLW